MALGILASIRSSMLNNIKAAHDAGLAAGKIRLYDGTRPATGGTATTLLAEGTCSYPCAPAASAGVLTYSAITGANAVATGIATWGRFVDSTGTFVLDGSVGSDITVTPSSITVGQPVVYNSCVITAGNP